MEIGEILRRTREARGLSLEDVAQLTKINLKYIKAIENDSFDILPGGVYTRGFLKSYARLLGLDPKELISEFEKQNPVEINDLSEDNTPAAFNFPSQESLSVKRPKRTAYYSASVVIVILAGYLLWAVYSHIVKSDNSGQEAVKPSNSIERLKEDTQQEETTAVNQKGLKVVLDVTDDKCWMQITTDGIPEFTGIVAAGNSISFQANERMKIKLGNAGAVNVTVNGRVIGLLGKKSEVVEKEFTVQK